ncbi:hypothetical protein PCANC_27191 [Puccinia coronata f. sp. avenae]|uniref:Acetyl-coenzyme A carboxylase carboxyl transferase subunit beta domain-containing protein n=1 Tax=Puccinia coronata f. sp. avenae TaxID=200324 RepID=A0A2N5SMH0_9BASI|nr:hypothetical protein PCANC_15979 [Puccinia coronata f. sp. avenae]PLW24825.1 hypothetical protein PCANC_27191 [Puccinia coronata f. sp. avenae]
MVVIETPQFSNSRRIIVIANNITFKIGTFGLASDNFFDRVTELSRKLGMLRMYLSANSVSWLGIADEVTDQFWTAWSKPENPNKGFKFLYLTHDLVKRLKEKGGESVITEAVKEQGQAVRQIKAVIGSQDDLVRIGAYLVQLGQRAVQVEGQPIILKVVP